MTFLNAIKLKTGAFLEVLGLIILYFSFSNKLSTLCVVYSMYMIVIFCDGDLITPIQRIDFEEWITVVCIMYRIISIYRFWYETSSLRNFYCYPCTKLNHAHITHFKGKKLISSSAATNNSVHNIYFILLPFIFTN